MIISGLKMRFAFVFVDKMPLIIGESYYVRDVEAARSNRVTPIFFLGILRFLRAPKRTRLAWESKRNQGRSNERAIPVSRRVVHFLL